MENFDTFEEFEEFMKKLREDSVEKSHFLPIHLIFQLDMKVPMDLDIILKAIMYQELFQN